MNYSINISVHSASLFLQHEPEVETEAEFLERAKLAEGKSFVAFQVIDKHNGKAKQFRMQSPYFDAKNPEELEAIIKSTFEALGTAVSANELRKLSEPAAAPVEGSRLILPEGFGNS